MDLPSTIQAPSGPMTRARARAIQSKVTSLLLEFPFSSSETWLLPKSETLCVIRYNAQATEPGAAEETTGVNSLDSPEPSVIAWNFRPPGRPAYPELPASDDIDQPGRANSLVSQEPARNPSRSFRPPEPLARPDLPAPGRQPSSTRVNSLVRPDPARTLRHPELPALPARRHLGRGPCTLLPRKLYILFSYLRFRVSISLTHILCESLAHPLGYFSSELMTSSEKIPQADSRPLSREDHQGLC